MIFINSIGHCFFSHTLDFNHFNLVAVKYVVDANRCIKSISWQHMNYSGITCLKNYAICNDKRKINSSLDHSLSLKGKGKKLETIGELTVL